MRLHVINLTRSGNYSLFQLNLHSGDLSNINYDSLAHIDYFNTRGMFLLHRCEGAHCLIQRMVCMVCYS